MKVKAFIERGTDGTFGVYIDLNEERMDYGVIGDGASAEEAVKDFKACYADMREFFKKENQPFEEVEFEFVYDVPSFLNYYAGMITLAGLEKLTGINQRQLSHYVNGTYRPSKETVKKIDDALHRLADELSQVHLSV